MICPACGTEARVGASSCANCGTWFPVPPPPPFSDSAHRLVVEAKQAATDLADSAARVSARVLRKVEAAADNPSETAKRGLRRAADALEDAAKDLEKLFRDLK